MLLSEIDYNLAPEMIAQEPLTDRDHSKLMIVHRHSMDFDHRHFYDIVDYLRPDDILVMNNTRVSALRLFGTKKTGAKVEALLLRDLGENRWEAVVKPGRRVDVGTVVSFEHGLSASVEVRIEGGGRILDFGPGDDITDTISRVGAVPLPPYIHRRLSDPARYQTVYAQSSGSAAAPTAGFHFTPNLLQRVREHGVEIAFVTLHVGLGTFRPVRTEKIEDHVMHAERISISSATAEIINSAKGRVISVGTTTARTLESGAIGKRRVSAVDMETDIFIQPGYDFKVVDGLITNFHMPKSTLMVLVSAFAGHEVIMRAYQDAKDHNYRFLSFGDAMFII